MQLYGIITLGSTVAVIIACVIAYCVIQRKRHFLCPRCGTRFKESGLKTFFVSQQGTDRKLTCPHCGINVYMENIHDEDYLKELEKKEQGTSEEPDEEEAAEQGTK
ncbi:MAG: hypothetical protein VB081_05575 [Christensenella sp.]|uniref:hypothetical protein n=1 Tax=Christensenella sp. TaxID=1935934 RepID=UPI002B21E184|nr:hypothetical protein [Christensenella sp.]MEA5002950.1 hypothetical protein [Christensenella sp.]